MVSGASTRMVPSQFETSCDAGAPREVLSLMRLGLCITLLFLLKTVLALPPAHRTRECEWAITAVPRIHHSGPFPFFPPSHIPVEPHEYSVDEFEMSLL